MKIGTKRPKQDAAQAPEEQQTEVQTPSGARVLQRPPRRPLALVLTVALALAGAAGIYAGLANRGDEQALVTKDYVKRGERLSADDFTTINVAKGTSNITVPDALGSVEGRVSLVDLPAGSLVNGQNTGETLGSQPGRTIVGVGVSAPAAPGRELVAGDHVRVVYAPAQEGEGSTDGEGVVVPGIVEQVHGASEQGVSIVDVSVESANAASVARWSSSASAALVLDPTEAAGQAQSESSPAPSASPKPKGEKTP